MTALGGGRHGLTVQAGALTREVAAAVGLLPSPAVYVDHLPVRAGETVVTLVFQELPEGTAGPWTAPGPAASPDAATVAAASAGWVPATDEVPYRGITPFQVAASALLRAAPDDAAGARLLEAVTRLLPPETVVVLADLLRARHGGGCSCPS